MAEPVIWLTKSDFVALHQCRLRYWLKCHNPELATPPSAGLAMRSAIGQEIDEMAQALFPGAMLAPRADDFKDAYDQLLQAIANGGESFLQATVAASGLAARLDVLRKVDQIWRITEVKSATRPKEAHYNDLAFQWHVAKAAGIDVHEASVVHVNTGYVRKGDLDAGSMLVEVDVTEEVLKARSAVEQTLLSRLEGSDRPQIIPGKHCSDPHECPFLDECESHLDPDDIYFAPGLYDRDRVAFRAQGVHRIQDLTDDHKMSSIVSRARDTIRFDRPAVSDDLANDLAAVAFPVLFLDFEAIEPPIPIYDDTSPYQRLPFQWSAHLMSEPGGTCEHFEFLWDEASPPLAAFVASLLPVVAAATTVAVYSGYEKQTLEKLTKTNTPGAKALFDDFVGKELDLLKVVRAGVYDRGFHGSFSIKSVLPALAPGESYAGLNVKDGEMAVVAYLEMIRRPQGPEREKIRRDLLAYCKQDTWAMVVVYEKLRELAGHAGASTR